MIILEREDILFLASAACAVVVGKQQITFFFTALWRLIYGVGYFTALGFSGLFLERLIPCCPAGGIDQGGTLRLFGIWCLFV